MSDAASQRPSLLATLLETLPPPVQQLPAGSAPVVVTIHVAAGAVLTLNLGTNSPQPKEG